MRAQRVNPSPAKLSYLLLSQQCQDNCLVRFLYCVASAIVGGDLRGCPEPFYRLLAYTIVIWRVNLYIGPYTMTNDTTKYTCPPPLGVSTAKNVIFSWLDLKWAHLDVSQERATQTHVKALYGSSLGIKVIYIGYVPNIFRSPVLPSNEVCVCLYAITSLPRLITDKPLPPFITVLSLRMCSGVTLCW